LVKPAEEQSAKQPVVVATVVKDEELLSAQVQDVGHGEHDACNKY